MCTAYLLFSRTVAPLLQNQNVMKQNMVAMAAKIDPAVLLPKFENICLPNMGNEPDNIALKKANGAFADAAYAAYESVK